MYARRGRNHFQVDVSRLASKLTIKNHSCHAAAVFFFFLSLSLSLTHSLFLSLFLLHLHRPVLDGLSSFVSRRSSITCIRWGWLLCITFQQAVNISGFSLISNECHLIFLIRSLSSSHRSPVISISRVETKHRGERERWRYFAHFCFWERWSINAHAEADRNLTIFTSSFEHAR